eukprot:contig_28318_g6961
MAAERGRVPVVAAVLSRLSAAPRAERDDGPRGALSHHVALDHETRQAVVGIDAVDSDAQTALHLATSNGHSVVVTMLLQHGAHRAVVNHMGLTPLYMASSLGHGAIVDQLGLGAEQPAGAVSTPMHGAAKHGRVALFTKPQLIPYLSATDETGNTPLHLAASAVDAPAVHSLVALGADVDKRNEDKETPFHAAVAWLERAVRNAEADCTRDTVRKDVGRRLRGAAAGHLVRRGPTGSEVDLTGMPLLAWQVGCKLDDFRAVVLCFLAAGVRVGGVGQLRGTRRLCLRIVRSATGFGPRQFGRLALTGRVGPAEAEEEQPPTQGGRALHAVRRG